MDANLNRLSESLKIIEDIIRFSIKDKILLGKVRKLRQDFLMVKKSLPLARIIGYRDSKMDPGRKVSFDKSSRNSAIDIVISNFTRAKESSRILEEIFKTIYPKLTGTIKTMRFRIYDIEKSVIVHFQKAFDPRMCVLLDTVFIRRYQLKQILEILGKNNATMIQLRVKMKSDKEFLSYALAIRKMIRTQKIRFIVNDRIDIASVCGADGVHLGQKDLPIRAARDILGDSAIIGLSVHNIAQAKKAEREGADYLGVGSVFRTHTKPDAKICGLRRLKTICRSVEIPVIGIGGINCDNYKSILEAGAAGIAVASYLFKDGDLAKNLRSLTAKK